MENWKNRTACDVIRNSAKTYNKKGIGTNFYIYCHDDLNRRTQFYLQIEYI